MAIENVLNKIGLNGASYVAVQGGDINESYKITSNKQDSFLKVNNAKRFPCMFEKEAHALDFLRAQSCLAVPHVIQHGTVLEEQYLQLDWIEKGSAQKDFWENFGRAVAQMHSKPQAYFGFEEDNYIGSLTQINTPCNSWTEFYSTCRIQPLLKQLVDGAVIEKNFIAMAYAVCNKIGDLFPKEPPALLHGDLWSGNFMVASNGYAAIFDPAVYFGHREMDIGMTLLFGGFDPKFYASYNDINPIESGFKERLALTQLYPLLVHAVLFGGHYVSRVKNIIKLYA